MLKHITPRVGETVTGRCTTCGRQNVTGTVVANHGNGKAMVRYSVHSHAVSKDDGDARGNGVALVEGITR